MSHIIWNVSFALDNPGKKSDILTYDQTGAWGKKVRSVVSWTPVILRTM